MTTSSAAPAFGEVWRLEFAYEDKPGGKMRPAVAVLIDSASEKAVFAKVTAHGLRPEFPGKLWIEDWEAAGLSKRSCIRCSKRMVLPFHSLESAEKLGKLSEADTARLVAGLKAAGLGI